MTGEAVFAVETSAVFSPLGPAVFQTCLRSLKHGITSSVKMCIYKMDHKHMGPMGNDDTWLGSLQHSLQTCLGFVTCSVCLEPNK